LFEKLQTAKGFSGAATLHTDDEKQLLFNVALVEYNPSTCLFIFHCLCFDFILFCQFEKTNLKSKFKSKKWMSKT